MENIDAELFKTYLPDPNDLWTQFTDLPSLVTSVSNELYEAAGKSIITPGALQDQWQQILKHKDSRQIWRAINWNGSFHSAYDAKDCPTDEDFRSHYKALLGNQDTAPFEWSDQPTGRYIPILDDVIDPSEVIQATKLLKANKAAGTDGLSPGLLKLLNDEWILLMTHIFNCVFMGEYPPMWTISKMFNIFKKGDRMDTSNYRGICILQCMAKLYDLILSTRFQLWYKPKPQQAGSQKGRGCEEQILVTRLLIDIARKCKRTLYVSFIDYEKAYDRVNRQKLLMYLDSLGCGTRFLHAIMASLMESQCQIGEVVFKTTKGVRQGACTSSQLFTAFIQPSLQWSPLVLMGGWEVPTSCY
jgi:hypothetical protein